MTDAEGNQQFCAVHSFSEPLRPYSPAEATYKYNARSNSVISIRRAKSENDIVESGLSTFETVVGEEFIDEDMCRVEGGDTDEVVESLTVNKKMAKLKHSYAPKCLILLSRVHDFRILKVIFLIETYKGHRPVSSIILLSAFYGCRRSGV